MLHLILSSDSHVFEPPDLWQTRIDAALRDRAPRIERTDGADQGRAAPFAFSCSASNSPHRRSARRR